MYAIIADSGKQFRVEEGQELNVDYREAHKGDQLSFDKVLCIGGADSVQLGEPTVEGASVRAEVVGYSNGPKLTVRKIRRRKNSRRKNGHRQLYTTVRINEIVVP
jgi:large subunit ribosomal protein L21